MNPALDYLRQADKAVALRALARCLHASAAELGAEDSPVSHRRMGDVKDLCAKFHGYHGAGSVAVYAFGVYEDGEIVAAYAWQPPPLGGAKSVCPQAPHGVLSLSRMVAVPRDQRRLNHVSKPLRYQMRGLIDRTRWPVLVTYSDEGEGVLRMEEVRRQIRAPVLHL